ncbi:hypothetical protein BDQ17DRAFT_1381446 [Cyathus striatus]|nr:hypothetical protein BDQ17DRAFT_1381446 [Cyathus striatus]
MGMSTGRLGCMAEELFVRGQRYSVLPALFLDGVLRFNVIPQSWTVDLFNEFIDGLLDSTNAG